MHETRLPLLAISLALAASVATGVVFVQVYCSDVAHFEKFNAVYRGYFEEGEFPARAFLGSGELLFDARFEVQMIAVKR